MIFHHSPTKGPFDGPDIIYDGHEWWATSKNLQTNLTRDATAVKQYCIFLFSHSLPFDDASGLQHSYRAAS